MNNKKDLMPEDTKRRKDARNKKVMGEHSNLNKLNFTVNQGGTGTDIGKKVNTADEVPCIFDTLGMTNQENNAGINAVRKESINKSPPKANEKANANRKQKYKKQKVKKKLDLKQVRDSKESEDTQPLNITSTQANQYTTKTQEHDYTNTQQNQREAHYPLTTKTHTLALNTYTNTKHKHIRRGGRVMR